MKKISEKGRRVLRVIYRGLGAAAVPFLLPACFAAPAYGMPPPKPPYQEEQPVIKGRVKSQKTGEPVRGISIWIKDITSSSYLPLTYTDGSFSIYVPKKDDYTLVFTDIDGGENGGLFKQHTVNLTAEQCEASAESPLVIELEEVDAE